MHLFEKYNNRKREGGKGRRRKRSILYVLSTSRMHTVAGGWISAKTGVRPPAGFLVGVIGIQVPESPHVVSQDYISRNLELK